MNLPDDHRSAEYGPGTLLTKETFYSFLVLYVALWMWWFAIAVGYNLASSFGGACGRVFDATASVRSGGCAPKTLLRPQPPISHFEILSRPGYSRTLRRVRIHCRLQCCSWPNVVFDPNHAALPFNEVQFHDESNCCEARFSGKCSFEGHCKPLGR